MREATGELNMSVIVISLVAILVAFFYFVIWPIIQGGQSYQMNCSKAICEKKDNDHDGVVSCYYKTKNGTTSNVSCKYKG